MRAWLGGILEHSVELSLCFAPYVNSYRRYQPGSWAPTAVVWSPDNRTLRPPARRSRRRPAGRVPDPGRRLQPVHRLRGADRGRPRRHRTIARLWRPVPWQRLRGHRGPPHPVEPPRRHRSVPRLGVRRVGVRPRRPLPPAPHGRGGVAGLQQRRHRVGDPPELRAHLTASPDGADRPSVPALVHLRCTPMVQGGSMDDVISALADALPPGTVVSGSDAGDDYGHDECLTVEPTMPAAVVRPNTTDEVSQVLAVADRTADPRHRPGKRDRPVRSGHAAAGRRSSCPSSGWTGCSRSTSTTTPPSSNPGSASTSSTRPPPPTDSATRSIPGEYSASLGGNVATNAGGMRAIKYGVTRHQVLGLELVLPGGDVIRTGGKFVKASTGYDLTQLVIGSEGTLALVTEATLKLYPRLTHQTTVLAPFATLDEVTAGRPPDRRLGRRAAHPRVHRPAHHVGHRVLLGTRARHSRRHQGDRARLPGRRARERPPGSSRRGRAEPRRAPLSGLGAIDVFVLPATAAEQLIEAREKAFWMAKASGADDIVDIVVPRAQIPTFMDRVAALGDRVRGVDRRVRPCRRRQRPPRHLLRRRRPTGPTALRLCSHRHGARRRHLGRARHRSGQEARTSTTWRTRPRSH